MQQLAELCRLVIRLRFLSKTLDGRVLSKQLFPLRLRTERTEKPFFFGEVIRKLRLPGLSKDWECLGSSCPELSRQDQSVVVIA